MLYKHWKKLALAVTSFFWASCDNTSSANDENSPESSSSIETPKSSSAKAAPESSATAGNASSSSAAQPNSSATAANPESSSETEAISSSSEAIDPNVAESSSSLEQQIVPLYGVTDTIIPVITPKYGVVVRSSSSEVIAPKYGVMNPICQKYGSDLYCEDSVTCKEETKDSTQVPECTGDQLCAKYGVVVVKETVYKCDDGTVYNEAEFKAKYDILDGAVDLYGCPSDICESQPLYGVSNKITHPNN